MKIVWRGRRNFKVHAVSPRAFKCAQRDASVFFSTFSPRALRILKNSAHCLNLAPPFIHFQSLQRIENKKLEDRMHENMSYVAQEIGGVVKAEIGEVWQVNARACAHKHIHLYIRVPGREMEHREREREREMEREGGREGEADRHIGPLTQMHAWSHALTHTCAHACMRITHTHAAVHRRALRPLTNSLAFVREAVSGGWRGRLHLP